ncbi:hypothetical protein VP01_3339g1 [Puccinia sorghi]|uniref:No apical meristem-associated C-terminal domain-containing protein n=1 Tax=Puccinia sorghi TaxID=27349 RepID=A0A0L6UZ14_9BASI|nr:hypothetical protein VP01_3339g1 [Puccinia sorghi]
MAFTHLCNSKLEIYEHAWNLLRTIPKWKNMLSGGKAKNHWKSSTGANEASTSLAPDVNTPFNANNNSSENSKNGLANWKRPVGLKLLKKANYEAALRIAEARRTNDIQEKLAKIDQDESDQIFILQDLDKCPYVKACKQEILERITSLQHQRPPLSSSEANLTGDPSDPIPSDVEESDNGKNHDDTNGDQSCQYSTAWQ